MDEVRAAYASRETVFAAGTAGTFGAHYAFPDAITLSDGTRVIVCRKATHHDTAYDGNLVLKTRSPSGTYSSEVTIVDSAYDERDPNLYLLASGRIAMVWQQRRTHSPLNRFYPMFAYCDGDPTVPANWSTPAVITTAHDPNVAVASDLIEHSNGDLYVVTYGRATEAASTWDVRISKSTAGGATWADHASVCTAAQLGGSNAVEPQIEERENGDFYVSLHAESSPQYAYYCIASPPFTSWSSPTQIGTFTAWNRGGLHKSIDGDWIFAYGPNNDSPVFRQSYDEGTTFGSAIDVAGGSASPFVSDVWVSPFRIGVAGVSPNLAFVWGLETNTQGQASIYYREFTRGSDVLSTTARGYGNTTSSGYGAAEAFTPPPASLTIDPASTAWEQIDTSIIVRVTADGPASVPAVVTSTHGGLVRFQGTDADLFDVSLDGTTWASTVDVPVGETDVFLRVTPETPGTTLSAEIGVPV